MNTNEKSTKSSKNLGLWIGSIFILVLSAVSFIFIPAMVRSGGKELPPFGSYNGKNIEYKQDSTFANWMNYFAEQYKQQGQQINDNNYYSLLSQAFNQTVLSYAFSDEVKASGYQVPEKQIDRTMKPYFNDSTGKYSAKIFRDTPESQKIAMRKSISENLVFSRYVADLLGDTTQGETKTNLYGIKISQKEIDFITKMGNKQRAFNVAAFSTGNVPASESKAFLEENAGLFAKYDLSVINMDTESEAKTLLNRIKNSEITFEDAAKEESSKTYASDDGKLTSNYEYQLKNILSDEKDLEKITGTAAGEYTSVIQLKNGYGFFKVDGDKKDADTSDSAVIEEASSYMKINEYGKIEEYYLNRAKDFGIAAAKDGFDKACKAFDAKKTNLPAFPINYGNSELLGTFPSEDAAELAGAEYNENFLEKAFSLKEKEISEPIVIGSNVVVLQLDKIIDDESADGNTLSFMYPNYTSDFDQRAVSNFFMTSDKLKNNLFDVYFNKMQNNK